METCESVLVSGEKTRLESNIQDLYDTSLRLASPCPNDPGNTKVSPYPFTKHWFFCCHIFFLWKMRVCTSPADIDTNSNPILAPFSVDCIHHLHHGQQWDERHFEKPSQRPPQSSQAYRLSAWRFQQHLKTFVMKENNSSIENQSSFQIDAAMRQLSNFLLE